MMIRGPPTRIHSSSYCCSSHLYFKHADPVFVFVCRPPHRSSSLCLSEEEDEEQVVVALLLGEAKEEEEEEEESLAQ